MPDEEKLIRKRRAAAEHTARVAMEADDAVTRAEAKVEKARGELTAARDAVGAAKDEAKVAHRAAAEAEAAAIEIGALVPAGSDAEANAEAATGGGKAGS